MFIFFFSLSFCQIVFSYQLSLVLMIYSLISYKSQCTVKPFTLPFSVKLNAISENNLSLSEMTQY